MAKMIKIICTAFLLIVHISYSASDDAPPVPPGTWSDWILVGKSCTEGAGMETLRRYCMAGGFVVEKSSCAFESDMQEITCPTIEPEMFAVVHGELVESNSKWPWQVFIELDNGANQCGGTLISDRWILTAAHCFDSGRDPTSLILGTTKKSGNDPSALFATTRRVCCHKDYNSVTLDNDICLIESDITIPGLRPVLLADQNEEVERGTSCFVTGWGYDENNNLPEDLQEAEVKIIGREKCEEWHNQQGITVVNNTICAGHESGGSDTCSGDSGGPLVCQNKGQDFHLYGVTSYGPSYCGAAKSPGIYTKVSHFRQWIDETMVNPCPISFWGPWSETCSVTCGRGILTRSRFCMDEEGKEINKTYCRGSSEGVGFCSKDACPSYSWTDWKKGPCSVTCGVGERTEKRDCLENNNKTVSSENCGDLVTRKTNCTEQSCPEPDFRWSDWVSGDCSVTCGRGIRTETRICINDEEIVAPPEVCDGSSQRSFACNLEPCPDFRWSDWVSGDCSVTCGSGTRTETRICINDEEIVAPPDVCDGSPQRSFDCNLEACPNYHWSPWSRYCSATCGTGQETRLRNCLNEENIPVSPQLCEGHSVEQGTCILRDCPRAGGRYRWDAWSSRCSVTCGQGFGIRQRQCLDRFGRTVQVSLCGSGEATKFGIGRCSLQPCQEDNTMYRWGPWSEWSTCRTRRALNQCDGFHSATRQCLTGSGDIDPYFCITFIGEDFYKEEPCKIIGC